MDKGLRLYRGCFCMFVFLGFDVPEEDHIPSDLGPSSKSFTNQLVGADDDRRNLRSTAFISLDGST